MGRVTGVPLPVALFKLELHDVAGDGGHQHAAELSSDAITELEDLVVAGPALSDSHPLIPRQDGGH